MSYAKAPKRQAATTTRVIAALVLASSTIAAAGPRRVIVLPIDGDADPAARKELDGVVANLAKTESGTVTTGDTTFAETAAAVGCDPQVPACADTVLATLGVDEIVFGTADVGGGQTRLVMSRAVKGEPRRDQTVSIAGGAKAETAELPLHPLFDLPAAAVPPPTPVPPKPVTPEPQGSLFSTRDRKIGFGLVAGGSLVVVIGLALWASESSLQSQIDGASTDSPDDVTKLLALEDRAGSYAWEGNIAVILGLAAAGVGTYYLVRDHEVTATVAPIDHNTGAAVMLGGRW